MSQLPASEVLEIMTRECRDLLDVLADKHIDLSGCTHEERNQIIRNHFANDASGYGIPVEEYLPDLDEATRIKIVNEVLSKPEYIS